MNQILAGLQIISTYDEDFELDTAIDEILAGMGIEMSEEDKKKMDDLNWFWDECWHHFT